VASLPLQRDCGQIDFPSRTTARARTALSRRLTCREHRTGLACVGIRRMCSRTATVSSRTLVRPDQLGSVRMDFLHRFCRGVCFDLGGKVDQHLDRSCGGAWPAPPGRSSLSRSRPPSLAATCASARTIVILCPVGLRRPAGRRWAVPPGRRKLNETGPAKYSASAWALRSPVRGGRDHRRRRRLPR
jgi:hypothetical protein